MITQGPASSPAATPDHEGAPPVSEACPAFLASVAWRLVAPEMAPSLSASSPRAGKQERAVAPGGSERLTAEAKTPIPEKPEPLRHI